MISTVELVNWLAGGQLALPVGRDHGGACAITFIQIDTDGGPGQRLTVPLDCFVGIDEGGLTLVELDDNGLPTDRYLGIGGVPAL